MKATWNNTVLAQSTKTELVEGNHYFPPEALHREYFEASSTHSLCGWKGTASYYNIVVNGLENKDAAWYYPAPLPAATNIAGYVAFWKGVRIEPEDAGAVEQAGQQMKEQRAAEKARQGLERSMAKARHEDEQAAEKARREEERVAEKLRREDQRAADKARQEDERTAERARWNEQRATKKAPPERRDADDLPIA
jgi:uncharacterized protein (DUF427 family)